MSRKVSEIVSSRIGNAITNVNTWGGVMKNVASFDAVGDGVTDDTAEIQAAIDAAIADGGKAVFFPHGSTGVYVVTSLTNADQVVFIGDNASFSGVSYHIYQLGKDDLFFSSGTSRQSLINGNFDIWQRGTSFTNPATVQFVADRWRISFAADGGVFPANIIHSRQALIAGDIPNSFHFYRINVDGAGSGFGINAFYIVDQTIENGTRYLSGNNKKVTFSFWAKSSIANKKLAINLIQEYGSGGAPSASEQLIGTVINLTSTWTKQSFTFTTNTLTGKTFGTNNDDVIRVRFWHLWGSTFNSRFNASASETFVGAGDIDIAQAQVSAGDTALPFQPRSFGEEERDSLRYNRRVKSLSTSTLAIFGVGYAVSTTSARIFIPFSVRMRVNPTLTTSGVFRLQDGVSAIAVTAIVIDTNTISADGLNLAVDVASGLTAGDAVGLQGEVDAAVFLNFDAEL